MKLGILQCDSVLEKFQPQFGNYPEMFIQLFHTIDPTIRFAIYNVTRGEYPRTPHTCDAYVTTGSKASVYDDLPWLTEFKHFLRLLYAEKIKLLGVCFGHQLIAEVFGGKTENSPKGWGVGVSVSQIVAPKTWMQAPLDRLQIIVSHQDQVTRLPENAQLLASNDFCPYAMYQLGETIISLQGHPEFSKAYAEALINFRELKIGRETCQAGLRSLELDTHEHLFTQWVINFFKQ
ncbi:MAG TPA: GMP synthase [Gammaproteobacteria bacterium]|nr:GMP synthase [Gammaproteobacteria bacterium]